MAAYPSFPILADSSEEWVDDIELDRSVDGGVKARSFYTAKKRTFTVVHLLNQTDFATFETFYDTNRGDRFDFTWAGTTYDCLFGVVKIEAKGRWRRVTAKLAQQ